MASMVAKPMSEAEAYVAEGAREISERLQALLLQHRGSRPRGATAVIRAAAEYPVAAAAAFVVGAILAGFLADRLICRAR